MLFIGIAIGFLLGVVATFALHRWAAEETGYRKRLDENGH